MVTLFWMLISTSNASRWLCFFRKSWSVNENPERTLLQTVPNTCAICLEDTVEFGDFIPFGCERDHRFHSECRRKWLERSQKCPICRQSITSSDQSVKILKLRCFLYLIPMLPALLVFIFLLVVKYKVHLNCTSRIHTNCYNQSQMLLMNESTLESIYEKFVDS